MMMVVSSSLLFSKYVERRVHSWASPRVNVGRGMQIWDNRENGMQIWDNIENENKISDKSLIQQISTRLHILQREHS